MTIRTLVEVINQAHALVDDICKHAEGLDTELLLEAVLVKDADFSAPMDADELLAGLKSDGLL